MSILSQNFLFWNMARYNNDTLSNTRLRIFSFCRIFNLSFFVNSLLCDLWIVAFKSIFVVPEIPGNRNSEVSKWKIKMKKRTTGAIKMVGFTFVFNKSLNMFLLNPQNSGLFTLWRIGFVKFIFIMTTKVIS